MTAMRSRRRFVELPRVDRKQWMPAALVLLGGLLALYFGIAFDNVCIARTGLAVLAYVPVIGNTAFWNEVNAYRVRTFPSKR